MGLLGLVSKRKNAPDEDAKNAGDSGGGLPPQAQQQNIPTAIAQQPSSGELLKQANRSLPPGRVRALWKRLDVDKDGYLSIDEILTGFQKEFGEVLLPRVVESMTALFDAHSIEVPGFLGFNKRRYLETRVFSRFYAEVLFQHFDRNANGTLQLAEVQEALRFLVKPDGTTGEAVLPVIAYPPEFMQPGGEVLLPFKWFWTTFKAME